MLWGINPSASAPHAHKHWFKEAKAFRIVVDPVRHGTAQAADLYLQVRPGTDSALAFAMLHVMKRDGLIDRKFLAGNSIGWDEVEALLPPCTPQWGEAQTGVPAADIERAARAFAKGPSLLWLGQGLQRQPLGGNIFRAVSLLSAASGNIGKPGAGFYYLNGSGRKGIDGAYLDGGALRRVPGNSVSHMDLCAKLEDSEAARALFCWNINIAASNPDQARLRRALAREDLLTVVVDLYQTDTADFADYVLPAASFLEFDDIVSPYFNLTLSAQNQVTAPLGEALPNQEIFRRLAAAMGFTEPELFESDKTLLANIAAQAHIAGGYEALAKAGTVDLWKEPVLQFADLQFPTPSGKIEIASAQAEADGHPRTPLPLIDERPAKGNLRLLTPASPWLMNSSYGNDDDIAGKMGADIVVLHPADARKRNIGEGASVRVANDLGELRLIAKIDDMVPEGTALTWKSRWPKRQPGRTNVNFLNPGRKADMAGSTAVHSVEVTVTPA